jgi:K+-transporting ATPase ATPase A chain
MSWLELTVLLGVCLVLAQPLGEYLAQVANGNLPSWTRWLGRLEHLLYRLGGIDPATEMDGKAYILAFVAFHIIGIAALMLLQEVQQWLPLNPQGFGPVRWDIALNIAVSFVTNTNWQAYAGERTLGYLTQMLGLTVQNFVSAAAGLAAMAALARGFVRRESPTIGNFWVDLVRATVYVLLPLSLVLALLLVSQGVVQTLSPYPEAVTLGGKRQVIAVGPAASQVAIKHLGTNGGGFFASNSAHPLENPTPLSSFLEMLAILLIPAAAPFAFGRLVGDRKQGWALFAAMAVLFGLGLGLALWSELQAPKLLSSLGVSGGNLEGKEVRFAWCPPCSSGKSRQRSPAVPSIAPTRVFCRSPTWCSSSTWRLASPSLVASAQAW